MWYLWVSIRWRTLGTTATTSSLSRVAASFQTTWFSTQTSSLKVPSDSAQLVCRHTPTQTSHRYLHHDWLFNEAAPEAKLRTGLTATVRLMRCFSFADQLNGLLGLLEQYNSPECAWRWKVHFKTHKKLKEQSRYSPLSLLT